MDKDTYSNHIAAAYRGELVAGGALRRARDNFAAGSFEREAVGVFAELEFTTADVMLPLMERHAIPLPDPAEVEAESAGATSVMSDWSAMMGFLYQVMPDVCATYDALAEDCEPEDKERLVYFAKHEQLLFDIAKAKDRAETEAALDAIRTLMDSRPR